MAAMLRGTWFAPLLVAALTIAPASADETGPTTAQKQAIYAKPSVVRVVAVWEGTFRLGGREFKEYSGGHGSGFFVSDDGFIATNAHVVREIHEGEPAVRRKLGEQALRKMVQAFGAELRSRDDAQQLLMEAIAAGKIVKKAEVVLPDGTKLPYEIMAYGAPVGEGKDVSIIKVETKDAPNLVIGDSDKMAVQDPVIAIGYPGTADFEGLFDSKSQLEASITDGTVSAIKRTTDGEPVLQVTTPITHGNSGGPAINLKGEVIGLATFGNRDKVQGFNFLVASSTVKQFVKEAKASNKPSKTQTAWRKALEEHWAGSYDDAILDYEEVMTLFPTHSEAPRMTKVARALKKEGKGKKKEAEKDGKDGGGDSGGAIAGVIIAVLLVGIVGTVVVIKKKKPAGAAHASYPPMGGPPGPPPPMMMGGRVGPANQPVAKTVAIGGGSGGHAPVAATAFGSFTIGSLTCTRGLLHGQRFSLTATGLLIGRQPGQAQVVVNDSRASGKHVWIGYENGALVAIDQGTTNGTFVNDVQRRPDQQGAAQGRRHRDRRRARLPEPDLEAELTCPAGPRSGSSARSPRAGRRSRPGRCRRCRTPRTRTTSTASSPCTATTGATRRTRSPTAAAAAPDQPMIAVELARAQHKAKRPEAARATLAAARARWPRHPQVWLASGDLLAASAPADAIAAYRSAIELEPADERGYLGLAKLEAPARRARDAAPARRAASRTRSTATTGSRSGSRSPATCRRRSRSCARCSSAIRTTSMRGSISRALLRYQGQLDEAVAQTRSAFDRSGQALDVAEELFWLLCEADDRTAAIDLLTLLDDDRSDPTRSRMVARLHRGLGRIAEARAGSPRGSRRSTPTPARSCSPRPSSRPEIRRRRRSARWRSRPSPSGSSTRGGSRRRRTWRRGEPQRALDAIAPALRGEPEARSTLAAAAGFALVELGRSGEAQAAAAPLPEPARSFLLARASPITRATRPPRSRLVEPIARARPDLGPR